MSIVLFAIIGAKISAGIGYWICFSVYCAIKTVVAIAKVEAANERMGKHG